MPIWNQYEGVILFSSASACGKYLPASGFGKYLPEPLASKWFRQVLAKTTTQQVVAAGIFDYAFDTHLPEARNVTVNLG